MKNEKRVNMPALLGTVVAYGVMLGLMTGVVFYLVPDTLPAGLPGMVAVTGFKTTLMGVLGVLLLPTALLHWWTIRCSLSRAAIKKASSDESADQKDPSSAGPSEKKIRAHRDRKLYLHLLSLLQTEGRFLDFLNEDLSAFDDARIGAAARGVHENCNRALTGQVRLQPVVDQPEGQPVTVDPRKEPGHYRLSGNVTGQPPFRGILTHPGWRVKTLIIPEFSFSDEADIIAPAAVEIR